MLRICLLLPIVCFAGNWVDEQLSSMSLEEKVGQLFVAPAAPLRKEDHWQDWERLLTECHIGNALLKASDPASQIRFLEKLQSASKTPLLIVADAEWGLGMRMSQTISFPKNLTLGAVQNLSLLEEMGRSIGRQASKVGIHLNLAPVADVNSNPLNPVIHMRSFGENPVEVAKRVQAIIRGMREEGLFACAKHFPGHGDTLFDSHKALPELEHSLERLRSVELLPFRAAILEGVECVMSGHLLFPSLDSWPTSLSSRCMTDLLRGELQFQGMAITDALNMRALTNTWSVEEIALRAYSAGHDLLLYGAHLNEDVDELMRDQIPRAYRALLQAFSVGRFSIEALDARVLRILELKEKRRETSLSSEIIESQDILLKRKLFQSALTQLGDLPSEIRGYIAIGGTVDDRIVEKMRQEGVEVICYQPGTKINLSFASGWIVGLHRVGPAQEGFGLDEQAERLLQESQLAILFCTPYALRILPESHPVLIAYENEADAQEAVWDALQGKLIPSGHLPIFQRDRLKGAFTEAS